MTNVKWEMKILESICDILDYKRKPITKKDRKPGIRPYYGATGILGYIDGYLFDEKLVLVGEDGAKWGTGESTAFAVEGKIWVNNHAHVLRPNRDLILDNWLIYYLNYSDLSCFVTGLTVPKLNQGNLREIPIPLPPLAEQQRLVTLLDAAFADIAIAKANAEKNLRNARELFDSHLNTLFTQHGVDWVEKRLGDIAKTQYGLSVPMNEEGKGFKIFRMGVIQNGQLIDTGRMKYADINQAEFEKYKLRSGDVLFNRTNSFELVGKTGIFDMEGLYCFASYIVRIQVDKNIIIPEFLNYLMNTGRFLNEIKSKASKSINQANINATILSNEFIQFPKSLANQKSLIAQIESLQPETRRLEDLYRRKIALLDELKQSLLQQAFSGNL